jgi:hypothetical protein
MMRAHKKGGVYIILYNIEMKAAGAGARGGSPKVQRSVLSDDACNLL